MHSSNPELQQMGVQTVVPLEWGAQNVVMQVVHSNKNFHHHQQHLHPHPLATRMKRQFCVLFQTERPTDKITRLLLVIRKSLHGMAHSYSVTEKNHTYRSTSVYCETLNRMTERAVTVQTEQTFTKRQVPRNLVYSISVNLKDNFFNITMNITNHSKF